MTSKCVCFYVHTFNDKVGRGSNRCCNFGLLVSGMFPGVCADSDVSGSVVSVAGESLALLTSPRVVGIGDYGGCSFSSRG